MPIGTVKWYNIRKGFGFIVTENRPDVFVHYTQIQGGEGEKKLSEGDLVKYDEVPGEIGPRAAKVMKVPH